MVKPIRIISFSGFGNAGKDYLFKAITEQHKEQCFKRFALADFLKELAGYILGMTVKEVDELKDRDPEFRQRILDFNLKGLKKYDPDLLVKYFINEFDKKPMNYIITDVRFPGEKQRLEKWAEQSEWNIRLDSVYIHSSEEDLNYNCGMSILPSQCDHIYRNGRSGIAKLLLKRLMKSLDLVTL